MSTETQQDDSGRIEDGARGIVEPAKAQYRSVPTADTMTTIVPQFSNSKHIETDADYRKSTLSQWLFDDAMKVPKFPLDRFAVWIDYHPLIIACRICDSLRRRSVVADYEGSQASCRTSSFLKYAIYLYAGPGDSTTVEVIRHSGCGFSFRKERESVLNAARGKGAVPVSNLPFIMKIPEVMLRDYKGPSEEDHKKMLCKATDRLHSDHPDDRLFILQNLSTTTTSDKVNYEAAQQMSKLILEDTYDIRSAIVSILEAYSKESDDMSYQILNACLGIFSNSMNALKNGALEEILNDNVTFVHSIVTPLINIVKECQCAHNTAIALTCLCLILKNSTAAHDIVNDKTREFVEHAEAIGEKTHLNLLEAAKSTLAALVSH